jgi:hypothetical protein
MGCSARGSGEADAVFEVWEEEMYGAGTSAEKAQGVFGVGEIAQPPRISMPRVLGQLIARQPGLGT